MKLRSNTQFSQAFKSDNFFSALQGGDQGLRAFHRRTAALPASSGTASDDALSFGRCFFACIVLKKGYQCWAHIMQRVSR